MLCTERTSRNTLRPEGEFPGHLFLTLCIRSPTGQSSWTAPRRPVSGLWSLWNPEVEATLNYLRRELTWWQGLKFKTPLDMGAQEELAILIFGEIFREFFLKPCPLRLSKSYSNPVRLCLCYRSFHRVFHLASSEGITVECFSVSKLAE